MLQVCKWKKCLQKALSEQVLSAGDASKLVGKLSWGASNLFHRLGRAMLRPLHDQKSRRDGSVDSELGRALQWWLDVLRLEICELRSWQAPGEAPVHLFVDARGDPPDLGAVVFAGGSCYWTHFVVPPSLLACFKRRRDNQIMGLELLAISLGLSTFGAMLKGRCVVVHSDNTGSEVRVACWSRLHCTRVFWLCCAGIDAARRGQMLGPCATRARAVAARSQAGHRSARRACRNRRQHCRPPIAEGAYLSVWVCAPST